MVGFGSQRVLDDLANMVASAADGAELDTGLVEQTAVQHAAYLEAIKSLILPIEHQPSGAEIVDGATVGAQALGNALNSLGATLAATAERGKARAVELAGILKKEIEEKGGGGGTGTGTGTGAGTGPGSGPGTTDGAEQGSGGGGRTRTRDPQGKDGQDPGNVDDPRDKPAVTGKPVIKRGQTKVRRCYKFRLRNRTDRPVSDIHFQSNAAVDTSKMPRNWQTKPGPGGFGFEARDNTGHVPPGRALGPFEFCTDGPPFKSKIELSHPDGGLNTPLGEGDVDVRGRQPGRNSDGDIVIPPTSRSYVQEFFVESGAGGAKEVNVDVKGGKVELIGDGVGEGGQWAVSKDGKTVIVAPVGSTRFPPGVQVRIQVLSSSPSREFSLREEG
jgi:hypothetical protein